MEGVKGRQKFAGSGVSAPRREKKKLKKKKNTQQTTNRAVSSSFQRGLGNGVVAALNCQFIKKHSPEKCSQQLVPR